jgi:MFS family permease
MMTQMETPLSSNRNKNKIFTLFIIFSAGLGGILYGYDIGVISGALLFVQKTIPMSQSETGFIVGAVLMGGLVGTLITGPLADKFGRRTMILAACVIFIIGIILILTANSFVTLLAARLFLGVGVGVVFNGNCPNENPRPQCYYFPAIVNFWYPARLFCRFDIYSFRQLARHVCGNFDSSRCFIHKHAISSGDTSLVACKKSPCKGRKNTG